MKCITLVLGLALLSACSQATDQPAAPAQPAPAAQPASTPSSIPGYDIVTVGAGGAISGTITVSGTIPKLPKRNLNKDPKVCGTAPRESQQLLVSPTGGLQNAIVIVEDVKKGKPIPAALLSAEIDQKNCEYTPHVTVVPAGAEIAVKNSDPILHNIHFYQNDESLFNIAQANPNQVDKHTLDKAGMVYAECDVHGWMQGHVAVVNNPYFAITDADGKFSIADLEAGTYKVKIWHEYLGEKTQDVAVSAKGNAALDLDLKDLLAAKKPAVEKPVTAAPADRKASGGAEVVVKMITEGGSYRFEPANLTVKAGTTVKWVNDSENRHTATDDPKFEKKQGQAILPAGVEAWGSPFLTGGETFSMTYTVPGKYQYFCRNHGQFGMEGTITVTP